MPRNESKYKIKTDELEDVNTVKNAELNPVISEGSEEYETLIFHAHAPYSEENTSRKQRDCTSKLSNVSVEEPIRDIFEKQKEVKRVKHVVVKELGYRTYRPTSIEIELLKCNLENFKDMKKFIKKIGLLDSNSDAFPNQFIIILL